MAVIRAPKKGDQVSSSTAPTRAVKKVAAKNSSATPLVKKVSGKKVIEKEVAAKKVAAKKVPAAAHRFPTKAELEALKVEREAQEREKEERKAAHRFPTKAELAARKAALDVASNPPEGAKQGEATPVVTKIDGEEVELEEIELEDLETLVEEVKEIVAEEEEKTEIRVVNVAEESQNEVNAFTIKDSEEDDAPAQTVLTAGATADPVKDYLKLIGRVPLLNAEMEVELSLQVEAGLFAEEKLAHDKKLDKKLRREYEQLVLQGHRAKNHLLEANLRLVVSLAKRYTGRGMLFLDLIQEGNTPSFRRT